VFDDIRVLVAISWTYITIAEVINASEGGLGALAYIASRQSRVDKIYAILLVIMAIGFVQDWTLKRADRWLFPYKYA
jgi:NitT/TauT family transport system permease protein